MVDSYHMCAVWGFIVCYGNLNSKNFESYCETAAIGSVIFRFEEAHISMDKTFLHLSFSLSLTRACGILIKPHRP